MKKKNLSSEIVKRVIHLNACLYKAALWIEERADRTLTAYFAGGGGSKQPWEANWEDFELDAIVKCSLAEDQPAFNPNNEYANLVAVVVGGQKYLQCGQADGLTWADCGAGENSPDGMSAWSEGLPRIEEFQQVPFCFLFHEVFEHTLGCDLDSMLKIGEIEINLTLVRQRGLTLEGAPLPGKREDSHPRSAFSRALCSREEWRLNDRQQRYARLLNKKIAAAQAWIEEQARLGEEEYLESGEQHLGLTDSQTYEDYQMMMEVGGCLAETHPDYNEDDDNIVVQYSEPIYTEKQRIFGRGRYIFHPSRYGCHFVPGKKVRGMPFDKITACGLFWGLYNALGRDWLKMFSIGQLWLDVALTQRRIIRISRAETKKTPPVMASG